MPLTRMKILLIDDDPLVNRLLASILEPARVELDWRDNGADGLEAFTSKPESYEMLVVDYQLPDMLGSEIIDRARAIRPGVPLVMLTGHATVDVAVDAMKRGALDFFTKPLADPGAFVRFVNRTLRLNPPLPLPSFGMDAADAEPSAAGPAAEPKLPLTPAEVRAWREREEPEMELTERDAEIVSRVVKGLSNKEIAAELFLSERTIKNHLTEIYEKFGVDSRAQLFHRFLTRKA